MENKNLIKAFSYVKNICKTKVQKEKFNNFVKSFSFSDEDFEDGISAANFAPDEALDDKAYMKRDLFVTVASAVIGSASFIAFAKLAGTKIHESLLGSLIIGFLVCTVFICLIVSMMGIYGILELIKNKKVMMAIIRRLGSLLTPEEKEYIASHRITFYNTLSWMIYEMSETTSFEKIFDKHAKAEEIEKYFNRVRFRFRDAKEEKVVKSVCKKFFVSFSQEIRENESMHNFYAKLTQRSMDLNAEAEMGREDATQFIMENLAGKTSIQDYARRIQYENRRAKAESIKDALREDRYEREYYGY